MSYKRFEKILMAVIAICIAIPLAHFVLQTVNFAHFSHQIAKSDHIVVTLDHEPVSLNITGKKADAIVHTIASAHRDTGRYAAKFSFRTSFFGGTNYLGEVVICSDLFEANGQQYRAKQGELSELIIESWKEAERESVQKKLE